MRILVLGAKGNLGTQLVEVFGAAGHEVAAFDRDEIDATDFDAVTALVRDSGWDAVVNAIAWNDVDGAEDPAKRDACWKLNAELPGVLAKAAREAGATLVHYSSDYVFSGDKPGGYVESDVPDSISEYGRSKAAGEQAVAAAGGRSYVCRTSKLFGPPGASPASKPGFADIIVKAAKTKPELTVVDDEFGCPTYTRDLAEATRRLVEGGFEAGIYHLVSSGPAVTWFGFTKEIFGLLGITTPVRPVPMSAFPRPAPRPKAAVLLNTKFPPLPDRHDALKRHFDAQGGKGV
ncbi:MAG: dTDP-4-dehydrorhamnose reductase [Patescibacteria group bacterium]|nr:dTDP-4-dehydrorhamnose reductase [Patescibacteria group bacterium]